VQYYKVPLSVESNKGGWFLEAIACNREDPMQSVSVTAGISNFQLQSSDEAYVHSTSLGTKVQTFCTYVLNKDHSWWELGCWSPST
jgi:hypothetical protein